MTHRGESSDMEARARERGFATVTDSPESEWTREWEKEEQGVTWQNLLSLLGSGTKERAVTILPSHLCD